MYFATIFFGRVHGTVFDDDFRVESQNSACHGKNSVASATAVQISKCIDDKACADIGF